VELLQLVEQFREPEPEAVVPKLDGEVDHDHDHRHPVFNKKKGLGHEIGEDVY